MPHDEYTGSRQIFRSVHEFESNGEQVADSATLAVQAQFFRCTRDLLGTLDATLHLRLLNPAWRKVLGFTSDELRSQSFVELLHPDDRMTTLTSLRQLFDSTEIGLQFETRCRSKSGEYLPFCWSFTQNEGFLCCIGSRIPPCEEQVRALQDADARLRATVATAIDGIITSDAHGCILHVNEAAARIFGYTSTDLLHRNVKVLMPEREAACHDGYLAHHKQSAEHRVIGVGRELMGRRRDGTLFPIEIAVGQFELGGQWHYTATLRDITERRRSEQIIANSREEAIRSSRLKSQSLARVSHELRTPMNGVLGMLSLALDGPLSKPTYNFVSTAHDCARSLLDIINDILDVSKIEAGKLELVVAPFVLRDLISDVLAVVREKAMCKSIELTGDVDFNVPEQVLGDEPRIRQVLVNLVGNSVKFTDRGHVRVNVTRAEQREKNALRFSVTDTGLGIASDKLEAVFEPFEQADSSTGRKYGGTGLGLTICRELVTLMGGRLELQSELGVGSTFQFELVLPTAEPSGRRCSWVTDLPGRSARPFEVSSSGRSLLVLIVEDHPVNTELLHEFLRVLGHRSFHAPSGEAALVALAMQRPDVILMDIEMPGWDGFETTRRIRAKEGEGLQRMPIIAVTANAMAADQEACRAAGMDGFLSKPIDRRALQRALADVDGCMPLSPVIIDNLCACTAASGRILNREELLERAGGDADFMQAILRTFVSSIDESMDALAEHMASEDLAQVRRDAHRLRGSLEAVSAECARVLSKALEQSARDQDKARCLSVWDELKKSVVELVREIETLI